jgi:RNA polymerase-binding protein DksA
VNVAKKTKADQTAPKPKATEKAPPVKPRVKPAGQSQAKGTGKTQPTKAATAKPEAKLKSKPESKPESKLKSKPESKAESASGAKPGTKPAEKPEPKPAGTPGSKSDAQSGTKSVTKAGTKPAKAPAKQAKQVKQVHPEAGLQTPASNGVKRLSAGRPAEGVKRGPRPKYIPPHVAKALAGQHGPLTDEQLRQVKTGLSKDDLKRYRQLLTDRRAELLADMESLQRESRSSQESSNLSSMPVHMADIGSDNYEQERTLGLIETDRKMLKEIEEAIQRIDAGTYGVCLETGQPIGKARLDAKPWAKFTIEVARDKERRGES